MIRQLFGNNEDAGYFFQSRAPLGMCFGPGAVGSTGRGGAGGGGGAAGGAAAARAGAGAGPARGFFARGAAGATAFRRAVTAFRARVTRRNR